MTDASPSEPRVPRGVSLRHAAPCLLVALTLACLGAGCGQAHGEGSNVVLVIVDTLRADELGSYGANAGQSPFLDELAARSVVFESVTSPSTHTVPATISILSGVYPHRHGNQYYPNTQSFRVPKRKTWPRIPRSIPSLSARFQQAGYATAAVVTNPWLRPDYGFDRGFDRFLQLHGPVWMENPRAAAVNASVDELLSGELRDRRFFLYLHYMDVHRPYEPAEPYRSEFTRGLSGELIPPTNGPVPDGRKKDLAYTRAVYRAGVRTFDDRLRELNRLLEAHGVASRTFLVVMSDHGEEFGEHGGMGHGHQLFEEVTRVPLLVHHPALRPRRIAAPVSPIDLTPTLLELADLEAPPDVDGISLAPWIVDPAPRPPPADRVLFSELGTLVAARRGDKKLIRPRAAGAPSLVIDLQTGDLHEVASVAQEAPWVAELASQIDNLLAHAPAPAVPDAQPLPDEPEFEQRLRAIGYLQ